LFNVDNFDDEKNVRDISIGNLAAYIVRDHLLSYNIENIENITFDISISHLENYINNSTI